MFALANLLDQPLIWDQVDVVAAALLERERLTGRELRSRIEPWNVAQVEARQSLFDE